MLPLRSAFGTGVVAGVLALASPAAAQDTLQHLKDLYASAAYEDALAVVTRLDTVDTDPRVDQYRVFCLVALGRSEDAKRAVEDVLKARPEYRPDAADVSPRIQELFSTVRRRIGPALVKSIYVDGKAALDRKDREGAIERFEAMLRLADDPDVKEEPGISELRFLGAGFLDLSRALAPKAAPAPSLPASASEHPAMVAPLAVRPAITPPVAIREPLPRWTPTDPTSRSAEFRGAIRVRIDADGRVLDAEIIAPIHPLYDGLLLEAARDWAYQPARTNGIAVPSEKVVQIVLKPQIGR
jgi:tetratricopeptide (TPR) repeat protein